MSEVNDPEDEPELDLEREEDEPGLDLELDEDEPELGEGWVDA
ncbi:hypothetical protein [Microtetraspora sp. AC03309]|nr:hypothetical protein [Microtetraspora sp. AC03309]